MTGWFATTAASSVTIQPERPLNGLPRRLRRDAGRISSSTSRREHKPQELRCGVGPNAVAGYRCSTRADCCHRRRTRTGCRLGRLFGLGHRRRRERDRAPCDRQVNPAHTEYLFSAIPGIRTDQSGRTSCDSAAATCVRCALNEDKAHPMRRHGARTRANGFCPPCNSS